MNAFDDIATELEAMNAQVVTQVLGHNVTRKQLDFWFSKVAPKNWKECINEEIYLDTDFDMEVIRAAIEFFTGSKAEFTPERKLRTGCIYRVRSAGYYRTIGA